MGYMMRALDKETLLNGLHKAIEDALSLLGESTAEAILWHLHEKGISIYSKTFDIKEFEKSLHGLIGNATDTIMRTIYAKLDVYLRTEYGVDVEVARDSSMSEKIQGILKLADGNK